MKLKYFVKKEGRMVFSNTLKDLALHLGLSLSGLKYQIKNKLLTVEKCDLELYELNKIVSYKINKFGIVIVDTQDKDTQDNETLDNGTQDNVDKKIDSMDCNIAKNNNNNNHNNI